jgi:Zn-dependent protease/CBS domain-containing protein
MKWSWRVARLWDIDIYMHATFVLIVGWVAFGYWFESHNLSAVVSGVVFILALFGCVVLHEYGHALTARRFGIKTRDITLYPIGGVARLERIPDKPSEELWVALAGPVVNLLIAVGLIAYMALTGGLSGIQNLTVTSGSFMARLLSANLLLAGFNLLPAFPMDGGRVLRAILAMNLDHVRSTQIAATVGQAMALIFGFVGLFRDPFLLFVAFFVWIGAEQEASMARIKSSLGGIPVSRAMQTHYDTLTPTDTLARAVVLILSGSQHDFPVVEGKRVVGVLERDALLKALARAGQSESVANVMRRGVPEIDSHEMLEAAMTRLEESGAKTLPVMHASELAGLLTSENIAEFMMIRSALRAASDGAH